MMWQPCNQQQNCTVVSARDDSDDIQNKLEGSIWGHKIHVKELSSQLLQICCYCAGWKFNYALLNIYRFLLRH